MMKQQSAPDFAVFSEAVEKKIKDSCGKLKWLIKYGCIGVGLGRRGGGGGGGEKLITLS